MGQASPATSWKECAGPLCCAQGPLVFLCGFGCVGGIKQSMILRVLIILTTVVVLDGGVITWSERGSGTWYAPANTVKLNQWQHIVVEYDCSSGSNDPFFFYNGSQVSATQTATPGTPKCDDSAIPKHIGDEGVAGGFAFDGTIDDVRIYNRFLTVHEIKRLYNMGR